MNGIDYRESSTYDVIDIRLFDLRADTFSSYDATSSRRRFATYWLWSYDRALLNKVSYILKGEGKLNEKLGIDFEE